MAGGDLWLWHDLLVSRGDGGNVELERGRRDGRLTGEGRALADYPRDWRRRRRERDLLGEVSGQRSDLDSI